MAERGAFEVGNVALVSRPAPREREGQPDLRAPLAVREHEGLGVPPRRRAVVPREAARAPGPGPQVAVDARYNESLIRLVFKIRIHIT